MAKFFKRIEWPTLGLIFGVYATLIILVTFHRLLPWWFILIVGSYAACLHSSLQHEALHGHPTRSRRLNELLVFVTPNLWLPYGRYRDSHLIHHNDANLTDPEKDPESYYVLPGRWATLPGLRRSLYNFNNTLLGRMAIGPMVSTWQFFAFEWIQILRGRRDTLKCWSGYFISCALVISFVVWQEMPMWQYILLIAYPSISLALIRSFCEHQAAEDVGHRTIIVEASPFWALLFLNNNLHIAHHERPAMPWYQLPTYYRAERDRLILRNGHFLMQGYGQIFRQYLLVPKEPVSYPDPAWLK